MLPYLFKKQQQVMKTFIFVLLIHLLVSILGGCQLPTNDGESKFVLVTSVSDDTVIVSYNNVLYISTIILKSKNYRLSVGDSVYLYNVIREDYQAQTDHGEMIASLINLTTYRGYAALVQPQQFKIWHKKKSHQQKNGNKKQKKGNQ